MGAFGKQRRTLDGGDDPSASGSFCDPLLGFKGGVQIQLGPHVMVAPAFGVAVNLDQSGRTSVFGELELNRTFGNGGYIGTGVGVWDFNHGNNVTGNLLIHLGAPIARYVDGRSRALFVVEGRLFFDQMSHIDNNYQFWAGLRYVVR